jgi:hypothetical protein
MPTDLTPLLRYCLGTTAAQLSAEFSRTSPRAHCPWICAAWSLPASTSEAALKFPNDTADLGVAAPDAHEPSPGGGEMASRDRMRPRDGNPGRSCRFSYLSSEDASRRALLPFPGVHLGVRVASPRLRGKGDSAIALSRSAAVEQRHARIPRIAGARPGMCRCSSRHQSGTDGVRWAGDLGRPRIATTALVTAGSWPSRPSSRSSLTRK